MTEEQAAAVIKDTWNDIIWWEASPHEIAMFAPELTSGRIDADVFRQVSAQYLRVPLTESALYKTKH